MRRSAPGHGGGGAHRRRRGRTQPHSPHHPRVVPAASARPARRSTWWSACAREAARSPAGQLRASLAALWKKVSAQCATSLALLIRLYQWTLSPLLGPRCRFYPTCSQYALEAIMRFGVLRAAGSPSSASPRCHPWHPGRLRPGAAAATCVELTRHAHHQQSARLPVGRARASSVSRTIESWLRDYPAPGASSAPVATAASAAAPAADLSQPAAVSARSTSAGATASAAAPAASAPEVAAATEPAAPARARRTAGARAHRRARSRHQHPRRRARAGGPARLPAGKGRPTRVRLENGDSPQTLYQLQSGLSGPGGAPLPNAPRRFESVRSATDGWRARSCACRSPGRAARRHGDQDLRLPPRSVRASVSSTRCTTAVARRWAALPYAQILRNDPRTKSSYFNVGELRLPRAGASGTATSTASSIRPTPRTANLSLDVTNGWLAALQHYFVSAIVPPRGAPYRFTLQRRRRSVSARGHRAPADHRARARAAVHADAVRRAEAAGAARGDRARARAHRRLRPPVVPRAAAVPGARVGAPAHRQLGHRDHLRHVPPQAAVLSAVGGERALDGEDESARRRA